LSGYKEISEVDLAWRENREQITLDARQILRRVLNRALVQLDREFQDGLKEGHILELNPNKDSLRKLLLERTQLELTEANK